MFERFVMFALCGLMRHMIELQIRLFSRKFPQQAQEKCVTSMRWSWSVFFRLLNACNNFKLSILKCSSLVTITSLMLALGAKIQKTYMAALFLTNVFTLFWWIKPKAPFASNKYLLIYYSDEMPTMLAYKFPTNFLFIFCT